MKRQWVLEAEVKLNNRTMEDLLIETYGCVSVNNRAVRIYVSSDGKLMKGDYCIDSKVLDSQTMQLPGVAADLSTAWLRVA